MTAVVIFLLYSVSALNYFRMEKFIRMQDKRIFECIVYAGKRRCKTGEAIACKDHMRGCFPHPQCAFCSNFQAEVLLRKHF